MSRSRQGRSSAPKRRPRYCVDIDERVGVLDALYYERPYQIVDGDSLSARNVWRRSQDIDPLLGVIPNECYPRFVNWLLHRVVMVGIQAIDSDNAFRIFESMNDRGARLTAVDLLKATSWPMWGRARQRSTSDGVTCSPNCPSSGTT